MTVTEAPWRNLTPTPLAFGKQGRVLLQYMEAVPPIMVVKVVCQSVPVPQGPGQPGKGR